MATNILKVHYHFEQGGKKASSDYIDYVSVASADFNSIQTVLSNNGKIRPGTLILSAVMACPSGPSNVLS